MASRLYVPYSALDPSGGELIVNPPSRCSHCNSEPAEFFETHTVKLKTNRIPRRTVGRKYRNVRQLLVRLPLCQACYLNDFLIEPDSYTHDATPQGSEARRTSLLSSIAGFVAAFSLLLITPFIPAVGVLTFAKSYWYILMAAGLVILGVAYVFQQRYRKIVSSELAKIRPEGSKFPRALVWANAVRREPLSTTEMIEIQLENEDWANECARTNHWRIAVNP